MSLYIYHCIEIWGLVWGIVCKSNIRGSAEMYSIITGYLKKAFECPQLHEIDMLFACFASFEQDYLGARQANLVLVLYERAAKVQASLRIRAVSPEPPLLAHTSSESRGTFRQKARSLAPLNGWACAVKICHDGMLEDTDSLDRAHLY